MDLQRKFFFLFGRTFNGKFEKILFDFRLNSFHKKDKGGLCFEIETFIGELSVEILGYGIKKNVE